MDLPVVEQVEQTLLGTAELNFTHFFYFWQLGSVEEKSVQTTADKNFRLNNTLTDFNYCIFIRLYATDLHQRRPLNAEHFKLFLALESNFLRFLQSHRSNFIYASYVRVKHLRRYYLASSSLKSRHRHRCDLKDLRINCIFLQILTSSGKLIFPFKLLASFVCMCNCCECNIMIWT